MSAAVYDWILRCCWFYVSTDSVCFSRFATCCPASVLAGLQSAMLCVTEFLQSADCRRGRSSASGSRNHRTALYCQHGDFTGSRSTEIRFGGSAPLHRALRYAPDIVRSQPRTASLLSGNSVLRADFGSDRPTPQQLPSVFRHGWLWCSGAADFDVPA